MARSARRRSPLRDIPGPTASGNGGRRDPRPPPGPPQNHRRNRADPSRPVEHNHRRIRIRRRRPFLGPLRPGTCELTMSQHASIACLPELAALYHRQIRRMNRLHPLQTHQRSIRSLISESLCARALRIEAKVQKLSSLEQSLAESKLRFGFEP